MCLHSCYVGNCRGGLVLLDWSDLPEMLDLKDQMESQGLQESRVQKETRENRAKRVAVDQLVNEETEDLMVVMAHLVP